MPDEAQTKLENKPNTQQEAYLSPWENPKKSKEQAGYIEISSSDTQFCGNCVFYRGWGYGVDTTGECSLVGGSINQAGFSSFWEAIPKLVPTDTDPYDIVTDDSSTELSETGSSKKKKYSAQSESRLTEAKPLDKEGKEWSVVVVAVGMSDNGRNYTQSALEESVGLFENVAIYAASGKDHAVDERGVMSDIGFIKDPKMTEYFLQGNEHACRKSKY